MAKKKAKKKTTKPVQKKAAKKTKKKVKAKKVVAKAKAAKKVSTKKTAAKKIAKTKKVAKKVVAKKAAKPAKKATPVKAAKKTKTAVTATSETLAPTAQIGEMVPALTLENTDGYNVNLSDLASKTRHLVLYFYPKDDTPGCTKEACDFRDNLNNITEHGATVVGVSPDSKESHQNFANKYGINFTLLADPHHELAEKMGVWKNKQFMGNSYMGVERSTFLFTDGKLSQIWSPVKVDGHVTEIIEALGENKA